MNTSLITKTQRSVGSVLALLALLAWFMPGFAMACVVSQSLSKPLQHSMERMALHSAVDCHEEATDAWSQTANSAPMSCCLQIPVPPTSAQKTLFTASSIEQQSQFGAPVLSSFIPLWALLIAVAADNGDRAVKSTFLHENFLVPSSAEAASPLPGRAPPSLI